MKTIQIVEEVLIFFAIASLWPKILHWPGRIFDVLMYLALAAMVLVAAHRLWLTRVTFEADKKRKG